MFNIISYIGDIQFIEENKINECKSFIISILFYRILYLLDNICVVNFAVEFSGIVLWERSILEFIKIEHLKTKKI